MPSKRTAKLRSIHSRKLTKFIGKQLRLLRGEASLRCLASELGLSDATIFFIEKGEQSCRVDTLYKIAQHFSVPISTFFPKDA